MADTREPTTSGCCGGPAPQEVDACCVNDANAKAAGETGCGCGVPQQTSQKNAPVAASSCCG